MMMMMMMMIMLIIIIKVDLYTAPNKQEVTKRCSLNRTNAPWLVT